MLTKNKDHLEFSFLPFSDRRHENEEQITASLASWFIDPFCVESLFPVLAAIAGLIIYLHRANIGRLLKGEEPKVGAKS